METQQRIKEKNKQKSQKGSCKLFKYLKLKKSYIYYNLFIN